MSLPLTPSSRPESPSLATGPGAHRFRGRPAVPPHPTSGVCKEELVLSVATAADPIPEEDTDKTSEVANGNEEQICRRERGS